MHSDPERRYSLRLFDPSRFIENNTHLEPITQMSFSDIEDLRQAWFNDETSEDDDD